MHCKSRRVYAETEIVSLVSSFVIVLTPLSESFAGSGFRNPGRWTVSLEIPKCNRVQWQEQPPERRAKRRNAVAVEGRETQGAATSSLTKSRFYKQYIFFKLLTKLGGLHLQDGRMLDYFFSPFFSIGYGLPRGRVSSKKFPKYQISSSIYPHSQRIPS